MSLISKTPDSGPGRSVRILFAALLLLIGAALVVGGVILAATGGSLYYVVAGLTVVASAVLVWRRDGRGAWLYGAMLVGTVAWSIWEVGFAPWLLVPRLVAPFCARPLLPAAGRSR